MRRRAHRFCAFVRDARARRFPFQQRAHELVRPRCTSQTNVVGNRACAIRRRRSLMTQEDWSGIGETEQPSSADSLSESSSAFEPEAADETWGDAAIGDVTSDDEPEIARAVPAAARSSSRSGSRSTAKSSTRKKSATRKKSTAKKSTARKATAKKAGARKKTTARKTTARKSTARKSTARKTTARKTTARKSTSKRSAGTRSRTASRSRRTSR